MKYMALIYTPEEDWNNVSEEELQQSMADYYAFNDRANARGVLREGEALHPTNTAKTVRVRNGEVITTDGPYAETKEALGGYYILDCKDLDEALEVASWIPGAKHGAIEVRPVVVFSKE